MAWIRIAMLCKTVLVIVLPLLSLRLLPALRGPRPLKMKTIISLHWTSPDAVLPASSDTAESQPPYNTHSFLTRDEDYSNFSIMQMSDLAAGAHPFLGYSTNFEVACSTPRASPSQNNIISFPPSEESALNSSQGQSSDIYFNHLDANVHDDRSDFNEIPDS